ncbi:basic salivary proline-rich protein 1-like [Haliaeetus albicilla]|uniref:basic salivary proline-rich protein 1-like n=1 Tax=Haliaeetus albicilla TaxID=8969 RepID=UPI0037E7BF7B
MSHQDASLQAAQAHLLHTHTRCLTATAPSASHRLPRAPTPPSFPSGDTPHAPTAGSGAPTPAKGARRHPRLGESPPQGPDGLSPQGPRGAGAQPPPPSSPARSLPPLQSINRLNPRCLTRTAAARPGPARPRGRSERRPPARSPLPPPPRRERGGPRALRRPRRPRAREAGGARLAGPEDEHRPRPMRPSLWAVTRESGAVPSGALGGEPSRGRPGLCRAPAGLSGAGRPQLCAGLAVSGRRSPTAPSAPPPKQAGSRRRLRNADRRRPRLRSADGLCSSGAPRPPPAHPHLLAHRPGRASATAGGRETAARSPGAAGRRRGKELGCPQPLGCPEPLGPSRSPPAPSLPRTEEGAQRRRPGLPSGTRARSREVRKRGPGPSGGVFPRHGSPVNWL